MDNNLSFDGCRLYKSNGHYTRSIVIIQGQVEGLGCRGMVCKPSGRTCPGRAGHVPRGGEASTLRGYNRLKLISLSVSQSASQSFRQLVSRLNRFNQSIASSGTATTSLRCVETSALRRYSSQLHFWMFSYTSV